MAKSNRFGIKVCRKYLFGLGGLKLLNPTKNKKKMRIESWIRKNRKARKLSAAELAELLGLRTTLLKSIESSEVESSVNTFLKMLDLFGFVIVEKETISSVLRSVKASARDMKIVEDDASRVVKQERRKQRLTQKDFSDKADVSVSTISKIEAGQEIYYSLARKIFKELNIVQINKNDFERLSKNIKSEIDRIKYISLEPY